MCITIVGNTQPHNQRPIVIMLVYRPPSGNSQEACLIVKNSLTQIDNVDRKGLVLLGDLNWDISNQRGKDSSYVEDICQEFGLEQVITEPTRLTAGRCSLIDIIMTNITNISSRGCVNNNLSDHLPVFICKKRVVKDKEFVYIRKRSMRHYDVDTFSLNLQQLDWSVMRLLDDVNIAWKMLYEGILIEIDKLCPYREFKVNKNRPAWYGSTLCNLAHERDMLNRAFRRKGCRDELIYQNLVRKRKEFNRVVRETKKHFYLEQINQYQKDQKNFWKLLNELVGGKGKSGDVAIERVYLPGTDDLCEEWETAEVVNNFFASVGDKVTNGLNCGDCVQLDQEADSEMSSFKLMTSSELLTIIKDFDVHKSSGIQNINSKIMLDSIRAIPAVFTYLVNLSLKTGVFPDEMKVARIAAIPKKGDLRRLDNLRPISLLSIVGKIIEKVVKKQLVGYFEDNLLFYNLQFGFRENRSTQDAIFILSDEIFKAKNQKLNTCVAYLDLSKAFNCVDHNKLMSKFWHYGIRGKCHEWFTSYLENRTQYTVIGETKSTGAVVPTGVPQGSVLGPIMYLVYVNDINYVDVSSKILMFADDSVLIQSHPDPVIASDNLREDLIKITDYFLRMNLVLNTKKTKIMNFGQHWRGSSKVMFPDIIIDHQKIEVVSTFKYLGVTIDQELRFSEHLENSWRSANSKLYILNKVRDNIPVYAALTLFKTMVLPFLEYGNIFMLNCTEKEKGRMQRLQNRGLKSVLRKDRLYNTEQLHKDAGLAKWEVRARLASTRLMFKYKYWEGYLVSRDRDFTMAETRSYDGPMFVLDRPGSNRFLKCTTYCARNEWNSLPLSIRKLDDFVLFKYATKRHYYNFNGNPENIE